MKILKLFVHVIAFVFLINYSNYSHANLSSEFIDTITKKASDILSSEKAKELKIEQLIQIGEQSVDIDGIGLLGFKSIQNRDYGIFLGFLVIGTVIRLMGNLISDICYAIIDPRIRFK